MTMIARNRISKRLLPLFGLVGLTTLVAPVSAQQYTGFVCEVRLIPNAPSPYGTVGHLQLTLTTSANCRGQRVPGVALYHLSVGATAQGADPTTTISKEQLNALLQSYVHAEAAKLRVRINTNGFGGGLQIQDVTFLAN